MSERDDAINAELQEWLWGKPRDGLDAAPPFQKSAWASFNLEWRMVELGYSYIHWLEGGLHHSRFWPTDRWAGRSAKGTDPLRVRRDAAAVAMLRAKEEAKEKPDAQLKTEG